MNSIEKLLEAIAEIHNSPEKAVIEFAGAGHQALTWLHTVGGSSRTVLEATDRYSPASLVDLIGFEPEQFVSLKTACAMAVAAYIRACNLTAVWTPVVGLGCTATIATDRTKRGKHHCCVAMCDADGITSYSLTLIKGQRTRGDEENLVSLLMLKALAGACKSDTVQLPDLQLFAGEEVVKDFEPVDLLALFLAGKLDWVAISAEGQTTTGVLWSDIAFCSGSFNPLHNGHIQMATTAAEILQQDVYFELPLINADKAPITIDETRRRIAQFTDFATVILTNAPLFSQKAQLFPSSIFILGADTVKRLLQTRFYDHSQAKMIASFEALRQAGCRFLVAGRLYEDRFITLNDIDLPEDYQDMFEQIPEGQFRADISSTTIREKKEL